MLTETARRMREKSQTGRDGPPFGVRLSTLDGCDTFIASRSHGQCFRGWHVGRNQSIVCATHEIYSCLVLSRGWRTRASDRYGTKLAIAWQVKIEIIMRILLKVQPKTVTSRSAPNATTSKMKEQKESKEPPKKKLFLTDGWQVPCTGICIFMFR